MEKDAKYHLDEIEKQERDQAYKEIANRVTDVKELLKFSSDNEGRSLITHYTSITASKALLLNQHRFRLSEGSYLNDTSEGREFFKFLNFDQFDTDSITAETVMPFTEKPYIGSFVADTEHNNLTLWRTYGKEGTDEACGCSITIDSKRFLELIKINFGDGTSVTKNPGDLEGRNKISVAELDLNFYHVAYVQEVSEGENTFKVPGWGDDENGELTQSLKNLKDAIREEFEKSELIAESKQRIREKLAEIAYLLKGTPYEYEREVRLVIPNDYVTHSDKDFKFVDYSDENSRFPKVYIKLASILPAVKRVTLGPKVAHAEEWAAGFHHHFN